MVSDEMICTVDETEELGICFEDAKTIAQDVIDAAWRLFDKDDDSTWPDDGKDYFVKLEKGPPQIIRFTLGVTGGFTGYSGKELFIKLNATHYADPQDLMPGDSK